jgi:hypothetical protein
MTRALALLIQGHPVRATRLNPMALPLFVLLNILVVRVLASELEQGE